MLRLLTIALTLAAAPAWAGWVSGGSQGFDEAATPGFHNNNRSILVSCDTGSGIGSSVMFLIDGDSPDNGLVSLTFEDGENISFTLNERGALHASNEQFGAVVRALEAHRSVVVRFEGGAEATFSLVGARDAISTPC